MDEKTKARALEKLEAMDQFIAYADEYLDKNVVDGLLRNIKISQTDYFENYFNLNQFWKTFKFNHLREQVNRKSWLEHTDIPFADTNYKQSFNSFDIPAGILQGSFYNPNIPNYMLYGSIGAVIGHEITHGFDDMGKQRNGKGKI